MTFNSTKVTTHTEVIISVIMVCSCFKLNHWKCLCWDHVQVKVSFMLGGRGSKVKWSISIASSPEIIPGKLSSQIGTEFIFSYDSANKSELIIVISYSLPGEN